MSKVVEVSHPEELLTLIETHEAVVVDFAAPAWCVPCRQFAPHFDKASEKSEAIFVTVDIDESTWAMADYGIQSVPTVKLFKSGSFNKNIQARTVLPLLAEIGS